MALFKHETVHLQHEVCCICLMSLDQFIYNRYTIESQQTYYKNVFLYIYSVYGEFSVFFDYTFDLYKNLLAIHDFLQYSYFFVNFLLNRFTSNTLIILCNPVDSIKNLINILLLDNNIVATLEYQYVRLSDDFINYNKWLDTFVGYNFYTLFFLRYCNNFISLCNFWCDLMEFSYRFIPHTYMQPIYYLKICGDRYFYKNATFYYQIYTFLLYSELFFTNKEIHIIFNSFYLYNCIDAFYFYKYTYFKKAYIYLSFWRTVI